MARPLRIEFEGAIYHVTSRGNRRGAIVRDDVDRAAWTADLERVTRRRGWEVLAYALMDNHFHVFLRTPRADLARGMQQLLSCYATRFAARHGLRGHVFQGRYGARLVEDERYFWTVARYVALNPVRAGMVSRPQDWPWSSHADFASRRPKRAWLAHDVLLSAWDGAFGGGRGALRAYREFVEHADARNVRSPFDESRHGWILGSDAFVERLRDVVSLRRRDPEVPRDRVLRALTLRNVEVAVRRRFGAHASALRDGRGARDARIVFAAAARRVTVATHEEVARRLGLARPQGAANLVARAAAEPRLSAAVELVVADLADRRKGKE